ncbi:MAG: PDZ domain-containing protein [Terriglobales bacterium]
MIYRFLLCMFLVSLVVLPASSAQPGVPNAGPNAGPKYDRTGESWDWSSGGEEGGGGTSYLGVDIADVSSERLGELKLKEEHGAEITMVDQDAPAGKAGLHEHDVIVSLNGTAVESAAQLRRIIKETPPGRVVNLGISRDGEPLTIKVQLADRHKSMSWEPNVKVGIPKIEIPPMDFDLPVSVVIAHSSARSGLMVENISPQLGDFFGVKGGNGVLVRSVEKGSRGEKAGFRAGDVVVKVNNQPVHDTSDFSHVLRSSSGAAAAVTVMRDKKEQNLTLTLPEKKDAGSLMEDSFDLKGLTAGSEKDLNRIADEMARLGPMLDNMQRDVDLKELQKKLDDAQRKMREGQEKMRQRLSGPGAEL